MEFANYLLYIYLIFPFVSQNVFFPPRVIEYIDLSAFQMMEVQSIRFATISPSDDIINASMRPLSMLFPKYIYCLACLIYDISGAK